MRKFGSLYLSSHPGRMDGRTETLLDPAKELKNDKRLRDRPYVSIGSYEELMGGLSKRLIPDPLYPPNSPKPGVENSPIQISANRLAGAVLRWGQGAAPHTSFSSASPSFVTNLYLCYRVPMSARFYTRQSKIVLGVIAPGTGTPMC